ncbi:beta strand repeat-containing protein, partial [Lacinutrix iliipiscaria]
MKNLYFKIFNKPNTFIDQLLKFNTTKLLTLIITVTCTIATSFGQGSESFDNLNASASGYGSGSYSGDAGVTWSYNGARLVTSTYNITGTTIGFGSSGTRNVSALSGSGGVGEVFYTVSRYFTGGTASDRSIEVYINGTLYDSFTLLAEGPVYPRSFIANESGDVTIEFRSVGSRQIVIDDVSWTAFSGGSCPTITVDTTPYNLDCFGYDFQVTINPNGGTAPYTITATGGTPDGMNPNIFYFDGFQTPTYTTTITVVDANGCESGDIDLELTNPELVVTGSAVSTPESCLGASDGTITYSGQSGGTPHVGNPSYPDGWSYYLIGNGLNISQSSSTFTNLAPGNYSVGASDAYGCGTGLFGIEVTTNDITPPNAIAQNVTVTLDAAGNGTLTAAEVDNGSNDNCSAVSLSIDNTTFSCADISSATTTNDLFISEYIEGGSNNKCIEIYNGTGAAIDLGIEGYAIGRYSNGASSPFTIGLSGVLADGDVYVVCHSSSIGAFLTEADLTDSNLNFNGDDAVALLKSGTPIDIFGTIGEDPGSYWSSTSNRTQNRTLVRNSDVSAGVTTNGSNFPTLETEWTEFPQDTSSELGSHTLAGGSGPIVTLTATDTNGNTATATANVTVVDDIAPNAICQAVTIQLDASGSATLDPADVDNGSNDTCGIASVVLSQTDFDCSHIGTNTVTLTVTDISGNVSSCDATITVEDNEAPIAIAQNVTVTLDATGNGTISAAEVDNGSNDNCGAVTLSIDNSNFTCADIVAADSASDLFISEYIEGGSNNKCIEIYNGTGAPIDLAVGNYTLERYSNGSGFGTSIALSGTIADGDVHVICNPSSIAAFLSESDETNSNINFNGDDAVALLNDGVTIDIFGKIGQDPGSQWSQGGNATANRTLVRNSNILTGNTDDITDFPSLATEWTEFPQDTSSELGNHTVASGSGPTVTLTVTDANNNSSTATANVIVIDDTAPIAICQNVTLQLDASGVATLTTDQVDNGSNDACGIDSLALSQTNFDCSHIGTNSVTLTVTDVNGNSSTCTATITVEDNESPTIVCNTITVQLNNTGDYTLTQSDINAIGAGSYDACSAVTFSVDIDSFDCNNVIANAVVIPDLIITEYVEGSSSNKYIEIYNGTGGIVDLSDYELRLYSNGNSSPSTTNTLSGTLSNGSTIVYSNSSAAIYGGASTVLSAVNWNGDDAIELWKISTNAAVDIFGKIGEDPGSQWGSTAINETQNQTLRRNSDVLQGNTDDLSGFPALQTEWTELPIDDVSGLGSHSIDSGNTDATEVILTATDANGNTANCTATIIVEDNIAPTAICQNVTVQLDANGNGTLTPEEVDNGSNDTCGILSLELNQTDFDCSHIGLTNEVTLTVTDVNGNSSTCTANVTVVDSVSPNAIGQNITVELDASGNATITAADIDNGSNDACGIESLSIDVNSFDCSNIATNPGEVSDLFISEYAEGSSSNKYIEIYNGTGSDVDLSDYELRLYSNGNSSPSTTNTLSGTLSNGSTIVYRNNNANIYSGPATVLSAVNWNGDDAIELWKISANAAVDIFGHIGEDPGSQWTQGGNNTANQTLVRNQAVTSGNTDNLPGFPSLGTEWTELAQDDVSGLGNHSAGLGNNVVLTVTDSNGNTSTAMVAVTVEDNQTPTITCPEDIEVDTDLGECGAVVEFTIDADDNCSNTTITQTEGLPSGTMFPVGTTTNTFVVTDAGGNTATCSFDVTVDDNEAPNVNCAAITVVLDGNGEVNVTASQLDDNSSDNCGIASYTIDGNSSADFTCADTGGDLSDLIISQYIDGPDANDCIEIYNGTGNTVELTGNYSISIYFNGITTPQVWPLLGSIANDDTYVICQQFSDAEATGNVDLINGIMWNGNDAVSLDNNGNAIDILGIIGNNPGLDWNAGGNSTKNT